MKDRTGKGKKFLRRTAVFATALMAMAGLAGCGGTTEQPQEPPKEEEPPEEEEFRNPTLTEWAEDGELSILMIGNSFSDDTLWQGYEIARGLGAEKVYIAIMFIGGCSVETHLLNAIHDSPAYELRIFDENGYRNTTAVRLSTVVPSRTWDYISLQQASIDSGLVSTYEGVPSLTERVRDMLPEGAQTKFVWNMTWAYPQDTTHAMFNRYDCSQQVMYERITESVRQAIVPDPNFSLISPTGTAIQNVRTSYIGDTLCRDEAHLTLNLGRYIAGLTFLSTVMGKVPAECKYKLDGMSATEFAAVVESVTNALAHPLCVTGSNYKG